MENIKCKYSKKCGGCSHIGEDYSSYLSEKEKWVNDLLGEFMPEGYGKIIRIQGMKEPYHYRHKVNAAFGRNAKGEIISGVYQEGTHKIVNIDECMIEHSEADSIIRDIRGMLRSFKIKVYDEDLGTGLLRHVMVRVSRSTGEIMVILVVASPVFPSKNNFVKALRAKHPAISTVVLNVNDKHTSMVLGRRDIVLYGKGRIKDRLCGVDFMLSPQSFFQVNPEMTEKIYRTAIDFAKLKKETEVIDAYSGIGTLSLIAAQQSADVTGVELNGEAVSDARKNAEMNRIKNVRFAEGDAGDFMVELAEKGSDQAAVKDKVVFMDPPRSGSSTVFLESLIKYSPDRVVYISCNPETLARDLGFLSEHGYMAKRAMAFDQFPWTAGCEVVMLLQKK